VGGAGAGGELGRAREGLYIGGDGGGWGAAVVTRAPGASVLPEPAGGGEGIPGGSGRG
jgi:hypothetical protein